MSAFQLSEFCFGMIAFYAGVKGTPITIPQK